MIKDALTTDNQISTAVKHEKTISHILAALLPMFIMGTMFALHGVYPFGDRQILVVDYWHQYYPFLSDFWYKLREGSSLLWSWTAGAGHDYYALMAYYMASPLNFLTVLFPHSLLREVLTAILLIKLGAAGFCMSLFLSRTLKRHDLLLPAFASLYALCAFIQGYYWNIMWVDTFALAPLVMLGVHMLVTEGRFKLYVLSLAAAVAVNFYMGIFVCIFTMIFFFIMCIVHRLKKREFLITLGKITILSAIALSMTAFLTLPAYIALQKTHNAVYSINVFPSDHRFYSSFTDVLGNFIAFTPPTGRQGLPNIYSGMISAILLPVFIISNKIPIREKIAYFIVLVFMIISSNQNMLDYMWHGFSISNMLPIRFSFFISFLVIILACKAYTLTEDFKWRYIAAASAGALFFILMAVNGSQSREHIIWNVVLCAVYIGTFISFKSIKKPKLKQYAVAVLAVVIITELSLTAYIGVETTGTTDRVQYPWNNDQVRQVLDMRQPPDNDFYRTDLTRRWTYNGPSLYGFNGTTFFSSLADAHVNDFMKGIGLPAWGRGNRFYYAETSPLTNAFLSSRYLIARDGRPADDGVYWIRAAESEGVVMTENTRYLPFGFMVRPETAGYTGDPANPFNAQNDLFRRSTGLDGDLFTYIDVIHVGHQGYDVGRKGLGEYSFTINEDTSDGSFKFNYEIPENCTVYIYFSASGTNDAKISLNNEHLRNIDYHNQSPYIAFAGSFMQGDLISVHADSTERTGSIKSYVSILDRELFDRGFALLADETLELTSFTDTRIIGDITVIEDGLLYTSLPHAGLWQAFVNGTKSDIITIDGAMQAVR